MSSLGKAVANSWRVIGLGLCAAAVSFAATAQSIEALRAAREKARSDLASAQEAFMKADDALIKALGGQPPDSAPSAAATPAAAPLAKGGPLASIAPSASEAAPVEVTFTMNGTGALDASPFDYRARLIADGRPQDWTETASGSRQRVPATTRSLAYEVQKAGDSGARWTTVCEGPLPVRRRLTIEAVISSGVSCRVR